MDRIKKDTGVDNGMKGFILETTPDEKYCAIYFNAADELCKFKDYCYRGTYNVVAARVAGMSFHQWLLYCAMNKAIISGKSGYAGVKWKIEDKAYANLILKELNKQWDLFMQAVNFKEEE